MKTLWIYLHAGIASAAWLCILMALSMALMDAKSSLHQDPVYATIAVCLAIGHLSAGSYLWHRVRDELRATRRKPAETAQDRRVDGMQSASLRA
jgi:hypothetical protein